MSLSDDLRAELARVEPTSDCDRLAELSGLFHSAGSIHLLGRGRVSVHLDLATSAIARRAFSLLRRFGVASEIRTYRQRGFGKPTRYQLHVAGEVGALQVLHEAGVLSVALAPLEREHHAVIGLGGANPIDTTDTGNDHAVTAFEQATRCRHAHLVDFIVNGRLLLNIGVGRSYISLWLVVIIITDEILHRILREKSTKFLAKLSGQGLIVGQD